MGEVHWDANMSLEDDVAKLQNELGEDATIREVEQDENEGDGEDDCEDEEEEEEEEEGTVAVEDEEEGDHTGEGAVGTGAMAGKPLLRGSRRGSRNRRKSSTRKLSITLHRDSFVVNGKGGQLFDPRKMSSKSKAGEELRQVEEAKPQ